MPNRLLNAEDMGGIRDLELCSGGTTRLACAVSVVTAAAAQAARFGLPEIMLPERVGLEPCRTPLSGTLDVGIHAYDLHKSSPRQVSRVYVCSRRKQRLGHKY